MSNVQKPGSNQRPVLQQGSKGDWTVFLQDALNGCGYEPLDLDGDFGPQTLAEVNRFQQNLGMSGNGVVDASTWTALDRHKKLFGWQCEWPSSSSLTGIGGVDTLVNVRPGMPQEAANFMGASPRFWGRYFQGNQGSGEYLHVQENKPLRDAGIRVIPISRHTNEVGGKEQQGANLGSSHAKDALSTFGEEYLALMKDGFYIFLDVEGVDGQPSLSEDFYKGWSNAVVNASSKVKLLPCVYLNGSDSKTSRNLSAAMKAGAQCHGLWVANYGNNQPQIHPWNRDVKPATAVPCKVLLRQYAGDIPKETKTYDFS